MPSPARPGRARRMSGVFAQPGLRLVVLCAWAGAAALAGCASPAENPAAQSEPPAAARAGYALRLIGERRLDQRLAFGGTVVGGLSGIDYDPATDLYYLISDDRSGFSPTRFYTARLKIDEHGFADVALQTVVTLLRPDAMPYPPTSSGGAADAEAIRFDPVTRSLWWTSEGARRLREHGGGLSDPFIRQASLDGRYLAEVPLAAMFRVTVAHRGPRDNRAFEGATLSTDARSLWVALEGPLFDDGPAPTRSHGAWSRFSRYDRTPSGRFGPLAKQLAYPIEPVPVENALTLAHATNGVTEILALDAHRFLVLERAFAIGAGWRVRLFEADTTAASDVAGISSLSAREHDFVPIKKRLVLDFGTLGIRIDNLEGLCFGPILPNGHRTLVLVSDDNFNPGQATQILAFEIIPH